MRMMFYSIYDRIYVAGLSLCNVHVYVSGYRLSTSIVRCIDEHWDYTRAFSFYLPHTLLCITASKMTGLFSSKALSTLQPRLAQLVFLVPNTFQLGRHRMSR